MTVSLPYFVVKGLTSNVLGFPGGGAYAILVAYICCSYPQLNAVMSVRQFFTTFANWYAISVSYFVYITVVTMKPRMASS